MVSSARHRQEVEQSGGDTQTSGWACRAPIGLGDDSAEAALMMVTVSR